MKVAGAFVKPKGITKNSKCPYLVLKAIFRDITISELESDGNRFEGQFC